MVNLLLHKSLKLLLAGIALCLWVNLIYSQSVSKSSYRQLNLDISIDSTLYKLPDSRIVAFSETVISDGVKLVRDKDYTIDYGAGNLTFLQPAKLASVVSVSYYAIPDFLLQKFYQYELQDIKDSLFATTGLRKMQVLFADDNRLLVTGSKTFSLTFSNQQSYDLKQSLFLQLDGELSENMKIEGRLSDSQTPLTPEGDSREISNLDQVYLKLFGRQYAIVFGDQEQEFVRTDLMKYRAKFEGINLLYDDRFTVQGAYAVNGGKPETNIIQGLEGKQGPYFLSTATSGQTLLIVAGSERVSVNGEIFNRGEDYTIDYSGGSLFFKRLITSNSRIIVNFQYSDDFYRQDLFLSSGSVDITPNLSLNSHLIKQIDNKNNPLQYNFSEADKDSLRKAGDSMVWGQGVFEVEPGAGLYIRKLASDNNVYYEYAENDTTAAYLIYFSYVGAGKGDYEPIGSNKYVYKGVGLGSWLPVKKLIAPADYTNLGVNLFFRTETFDIATEGIYTNQDKNTFSDIDDSDNQSYIAKASAGFTPTEIKYNPKLKLVYLLRGDNSFTFSNLIPDNEMYEFSSIPAMNAKAQQQLDFLLGFDNAQRWSQNFSARLKNVKDIYTQKFIRTETRINQIGLYPALMWYGLYSSQAFSDSVLVGSKLHYHDVDGGWRYKILTFKTRYLLQRESYDYAVSDSIPYLKGTQFTRFNPMLKVSDESSYSTTLSYSAENNSRQTEADWQTLSTGSTWQFDQILNRQFNTLRMSLTHRETDYHFAGEDAGSTRDQKFDLFDIKSTHQLWDNSISLNSSYSLNRLEFFPKIKELQYVGSGLGSYDADSVYVINGDYDYVFTTSGSGQLAAEINANLNLNYHLSQKFLQNSIWHRFHLDSSFQATNNTTEKGDWELYLLLPKDFFQSDSTKFGRRFMQHNLRMDLWRNKLAGNLRYEVSNTLDNRYQEFSKTFIENRQIELDWKQIRGYKIQTSYHNGIEQNSRYSSEVKVNELSAVLFRSFSASANMQLTTSYAHEKGNSTTQSQPYTISSIRTLPTVTIYFQNRYRITTNFSAQFNRRKGSDLLTFLPEKRNGGIYTWSVQTQYRLNSFTSGVFEYSGKSYPKEEVLHELKMEFRAEL